MGELGLLLLRAELVEDERAEGVIVIAQIGIGGADHLDQRLGQDVRAVRIGFVIERVIGIGDVRHVGVGQHLERRGAVLRVHVRLAGMLVGNLVFAAGVLHQFLVTRGKGEIDHGYLLSS